tara:strand:- start:535 stop:720 length:186 start_codon:yes stop_codon:yes gene_type:complete
VIKKDFNDLPYTHNLKVGNVTYPNTEWGRKQADDARRNIQRALITKLQQDRRLNLRLRKKS